MRGERAPSSKERGGGMTDKKKGMEGEDYKEERSVCIVVP